MARASRPIKELPTVGAERALKVLAGRWKLTILWHTLEGPLRLRALEQRIEGCSQKVLIGQLRELEVHGLVARTVHAASPVRVEYTATALGHSLRPLILELCAWGRRHAAATARCTRSDAGRR